jgi:hypothetical protein
VGRASRVGLASWLGLLLACGPEGGAAPRSEQGRTARAAAQPETAARSGPPGQPEPRAEPTQPPVHASAAGSNGRRLRFAGDGPDQDFVLEQIGRGRPLSFKPVGPTATVMRLRLAAPFDAAFKPVTKVRPLGPAAEVAAYRVSRCLGLDAVPPAITREFAAADIRAALDPESSQSWPALRQRLGVVDDAATVRGVAIYWINDLTTVGLEKRSGLRLVREWLHAGGVIPAASRSLAASISTMLAFDYLIGNFDRWSGGNVLGDARARRVYVRDHDLAFPVRMTEKLHRRLWQDLQHGERFSRNFYAALERLSRDCVERELGSDPAFARGPLLNRRQLAGVFDRREALISYIESLIALHGERNVLVFD